MTILPIPSGRTSDLLTRQRQLLQLQENQLRLLESQQQVSTGRRIATPSDDVTAATQAILLQRRIEQQSQIETNISTTRSFLNATDSAIGRATDLLIDIRGLAVTAFDATTDETQRQAIALEIQQAIAQLANIANTEFRGRHLFAGSDTDQTPFRFDGGNVVYDGNTRTLETFTDLGFLLQTNISGDDVFGAISSSVQSSVQLHPQLRLTTPLADLLGGAGIDPAGIEIVNAGETFAISFAGAQTVEDVLNLINGSGANVLAEINAEGTGLNVRSRTSGGDFAIGENGGATATQLGLRTLTLATRLSDLNHGRGVNSTSGTDFTIHRRDSVNLEIDVSSATTIADVIDLINNHAGNIGAAVVARLAANGNGIELIDASAGSDTLTVTTAATGSAAEDLGLIPIGATSASASATSPGSLNGRDPNPREIAGAFNSLIRLHDAVVNLDFAEIGRITAMLDADITRTTVARAEIGIRVRNLEALQQHLETENLELQDALSNEIDADLTEAISNFTARQLALEASLRVVAQSFQLSLLNFI